MAVQNKLKFDPTKFKAGQREAAHKLVEKDFNGGMTKEGIAQDAGVTRMTLYWWEYYDDNFIAYRNYVASDFMNSKLGFVYKKLLEGIDEGSQRAIETYLKRIGDMDNNTDVTVHQGTTVDQETFEQRKKDLMARIDGLSPEDVEKTGQQGQLPDNSTNNGGGQ